MKTTQKKTTEKTRQPSLARCVAGEDLELDEYIAVHSTTGEFLSHAWDRSDLSPDQVVRVRYIPSTAGQPVKVVGICLPFVYVQDRNESTEIIDLRMTQVVRIERECAKEIWKLSKAKRS